MSDRSRLRRAADPAHDRLHEVTRIVDGALASFEAPPGWRVLRCTGRLEARWEGAGGRWATFSARLGEDPASAPAGAVFFRRPIGAGHLVVTFDSGELDEETVAAATELLTPLQRMLARAAES